MSDLKLVKNDEANQEIVNYDFKKNAEADASCIYAVAQANPNHTLRELKKIADIEFKIDEVTFENRFNDLKRTGDIITNGTKICTVSGKTAGTVTVNACLAFNITTHKLLLKKLNKQAASVRVHDELVADVQKFCRKLINFRIGTSAKLQILGEANMLINQILTDVDNELSQKRGWKQRQLEAFKRIKTLAHEQISHLPTNCVENKNAS